MAVDSEDEVLVSADQLLPEFLAISDVVPAGFRHAIGVRVPGLLFTELFPVVAGVVVVDERMGDEDGFAVAVAATTSLAQRTTSLRGPNSRQRTRNLRPAAEKR